MTRKIKILRVIFTSTMLIFSPQLVLAKGERLIISDFSHSNFKVKNPFEAQFQEIKVDESKNKKTIKKEETEKQVNTSEAITLPAMNVTGLVWNSKRPQAIINGQVVNIGDTVSDAKIIKITKNEIEFLYMETTFKITP